MKALFLALLIFLAGCTAAAQPLGEMTIHKSSTCGCCSLWASFADKEGFDVETRDTIGLAGLKRQLGVPPALESCHTAQVDGYFIEGHVPSEAIKRLLVERPDIKGIAMPGMPSGSPGMPGAKQGPFVIYAVAHDGSYTEWMRI